MFLFYACEGDWLEAIASQIVWSINSLISVSTNYKGSLFFMISGS
jgi:hypothetical protein